ncbi:hypothetical protein HK098_005870 [Nowakowskiella sp. JEL0407]|nr:hypothetical protein HK098_005870 [Nowakowskiella sp. JEL0407]
MFGAFRSTFTAMGGLLWKRRYFLSQTQKYRHRKRLQGVDDVIEKLRISGARFKALDSASLLPKESEMSAKEKYW